MHQCPHCHKLGISSFAAIGNPFAHGLASCRYCNLPSKRRNAIAAYIGGPITLAVWWGWVKLVNPPLPFWYFWLAVIGFAGVFIIDRLTTYEKAEMEA